MRMTDWARREVELACKKENPNRAKGEWDYGCACYESALKAFESLLGDDHSGMSIQITKSILNRLIDGKCLTPITDDNAEWRSVGGRCKGDSEAECYQSGQNTSLFKYVHADGSVTFSDIHNCVGIDIDTQITYGGGVAHKIVDEMFPIQLPYLPPDYPYRVFTEEFLTDADHGDFDTVAILYIVTPRGERVEVNRYFSLDHPGVDEITKEEYEDRKGRKVARR